MVTVFIKTPFSAFKAGNLPSRAEPNPFLFLQRKETVRGAKEKNGAHQQSAAFFFRRPGFRCSRSQQRSPTCAACHRDASAPHRAAGRAGAVGVLALLRKTAELGERLGNRRQLHFAPATGRKPHFNAGHAFFWGHPFSFPKENGWLSAGQPGTVSPVGEPLH